MCSAPFTILARFYGSDSGKHQDVQHEGGSCTGTYKTAFYGEKRRPRRSLAGAGNMMTPLPPPSLILPPRSHYLLKRTRGTLHSANCTQNTLAVTYLQ